jgi:hypothetical protein
MCHRLFSARHKDSVDERKVDIRGVFSALTMTEKAGP